MHIQQSKQMKYSKMLHNGCNFSDCNRYFFNPFFLNNIGLMECLNNLV